MQRCERTEKITHLVKFNDLIKSVGVYDGDVFNH